MLTRSLLIGLAGLSLCVPALADEAPHLSIELNTTDSVEAGCRLTFVVEHNLASDLSDLVFETVLFDASGQVDRLTLFDFGSVPPNRPRVRQFEMADLACTDLSRVLFNGVNACSGEGIDAEMCNDLLKVRSRSEVEVLG
ncbi:hypothetical protein [Thalassococcus sp. S3]|uniref:hypothetical protein n=1 Tax=Thalassococcus sp. S3 TaxID=2017482 RepID=UPI0010240D7D|nr:hypothetical protein [Thalassococcus sp. S3]QBF30455.1 hypothetical protein CFI11_04405 [Thalassococcus sp. S3]